MREVLLEKHKTKGLIGSVLMKIERITVLNELVGLFRAHDIEGFHLIDGTLCLNRVKKIGPELSAACKTPDGDFILRCIQKENATGGILSYTITLSDKKGVLLREFGYSAKQGYHRHDVVNGFRMPNNHIKTTENLEDVVLDFIAIINGER